MYTIREAAARSGMTVALLRAWERRYGIVEPARTPAGYRLYDDAAIARLRTMRDLVARGWAPSQAARAIQEGDPAVLRELASVEPRITPPDAVGTPAGQAAELRLGFVHAARDLDAGGLEAILDEMFASATYERMVDSILLPALRDVGDAWAAGDLDVAGEHAASHAVVRRLSGMFRAASRPGSGPSVIVGLPEACRHEIAALAFAVTLVRRGVGTIYLGADMPTASWVLAARHAAARAAVLGVPTRDDRPAAGAATAELIARGVPVFVGGHGVTDDVPAGAIRLPDPMTEAADVVVGYLERQSPDAVG